MKTILLTQQQEAIVDDEDYEYLLQWMWYAHWDPKANCFYAYSSDNLTGKNVKMHRIVMEYHGHTIKGLDVHHKNGESLDNRYSNLEVLTRRQHGGKRIDGSSSHPGVSIYKPTGKWRAQIQIHIGYYNSEEEAYLAYQDYKREHGID